METKTCKVCGRELPLTEFPVTRSGSRFDTCRECRANALRETKAANRSSWITLSEWVFSEEKGRRIPKYVKTEYVDDTRIKPDTWYKLVDGEFVECDD